MKKPDDPSVLATAAPLRNFSLSIGARVSAMIAGLPAHIRRLRRIEDLERALTSDLARAWTDAQQQHGDTPRARAAALDGAARLSRVSERLALLNRLIDDHNRYYPIEKNLPIDRATGVFLDLGEPWRPLPRATLEQALARAIEP